MRTKIFFLAVFFGVLGLAKSSSAATINAASASYADVSAAVAAADYNDTVRVPAGEENWGNNTLTITKGIKLLGAGKTQTIINSAPTTYSYDKFLIYFNADSTTAANDYQFKLDGFYLKANGTEPPHALLYLNNSHLGDHLTKVIISNNKFKQIAGTLPYSGRTRMAIYLNLAVFGVTYNNEIIDGTHAWRFLGTMSTGKNVVYWEPGSQYAMYFEDNNIYISEDWNANMIISGGAGNRYVSRYNTFDLSARGSSDYTQAHDIHGNQENNPGAGIGYEAYGEHRIGGQGEFFDNRAGRVHFFMNKWSYSSGTSYVTYEEYNDDAYMVTSCVGLSYSKTVGGVNCVQSPYDSYYWRNYGGMSGTSLITGIGITYDHYNMRLGILNDPLTLIENKTWWRDNSAAFDGSVAAIGSCGYYGGPSCTKSGIGCGTLANRPATCTTGTAYWATNQGNCNDLSDYVGHTHTKKIEGTLYKCTSTNTWTAYYTPYTYPHPLRAEGAGTDTTPPSAPSGVIVN